MLPRSVKIRGHSFRVEQVNNSALEGSIGELDSDKNLIRFRKRIPPSRKVEVLLHEVLHEMFPLKARGEEQIVSELARGLTQFIRDNPGFFRHAAEVLR